MDELKQALAEAEQSLQTAYEAKDTAEQAYYKAVMGFADAQAKLETAKSALIAAAMEAI